MHVIASDRPRYLTNWTRGFRCWRSNRLQTPRKQPAFWRGKIGEEGPGRIPGPRRMVGLCLVV